CSNQNCMKDKTLKLLNRDLAATLNFRHILMSLKENHTLPESKPSGLSPSFASPVTTGASVD
ncbi:hypothetical protein BDF14DRAFT_1835962, partial [Spinellus fusiger]